MKDSTKALDYVVYGGLFAVGILACIVSYRFGVLKGLGCLV